MSLDFYLKNARNKQVFWANITHNLGEMAEAAGIYQCLWHPENGSIERARDMIPLLKEGLELLKSKPEYFKMFDSPNGWGTYENFVPFVEECLQACRKHRTARVEVSI